MDIRRQKCYCNALLTILHEFYTIFLSDSFNQSKYFLENKAIADFYKKLLIEKHYQTSLNLKELRYLEFLETNSLILKSYISEFLSAPDLFSKDPNSFNDQIETFNLEPHEVNFIREFFIKFYPNFDVNNFEKIDLKKVVCPNNFINIFNNIFTNSTNCPTNYYFLLEYNINNSL